MQSALLARMLRFSVFALLLLCTLVAIALSETMWQLWRPGELPGWAPLVAPFCFSLLLLVFALDRFVAVRRQEESTPRAIIQVGTAVFLLSLLLPQEALEMRRALHRRARASIEQDNSADSPQAPRPTAPLLPTALLLSHEDDAVREATCLWLAAGEWRPHAEPAEASRLLHALREQVALVGDSDPCPEVREACVQALGQLQDSDDDGAQGVDDGTEYL